MAITRKKSARRGGSSTSVGRAKAASTKSRPLATAKAATRRSSAMSAEAGSRRTAEARRHKSGNRSKPVAAKAPARVAKRRPRAAALVAAKSAVKTHRLATTSTHYGSSAWTPAKGYASWTKQGEVAMFDNGGQRAVELMLMTTAACLNFFLVEHVKANNLPVTSIRVSCDGKIVPSPDRLGEITTRVVIEGTLTREDRRRMLASCDRQWKVMNTIRHAPVCKTVLVSPAGEIID